ncbi:hypothetical protein RUM44_009180 [Polyplax serrata]|uniref:Uncharacterized protein n=1 Tax=Polyplax serrata TaxID=468196 RepID=A0ABR1ARY7_POLSC
MRTVWPAERNKNGTNPVEGCNGDDKDDRKWVGNCKNSTAVNGTPTKKPKGTRSIVNLQQKLCDVFDSKEERYDARNPSAIE